MSLPPSTPAAIAPTPETLGMDGAPAIQRLEWRVGGQTQVLTLTAQEVIVQTGAAAPQRVQIQDVKHVSARRWRPTKHVVTAVILGALAASASRDSPQWLSASVLGFLAVLFLTATSWRFGDFQLNAGTRVFSFRLTKTQWATAQAVVAAITTSRPEAARAPLRFSDLIVGAAVDLVAPREVLLRRLRQRTPATAWDASQEGRAVILGRRIAAWNLLFSTVFPLTVVGVWFVVSPPQGVSAYTVVRVFLLLPLSVVGLVLQSRFLGAGRRWMERP